ncbi:DUF3858 domain-containing protein [Bacteroides sp. 214]|uniref:DUF3857 domain-containing protein n=1 Tax=Bacteroides sp. 214 TaxID=2302935 RepID=UPI0013D81AA8|nr:DUF3857 domain-containing protein [Bacteroides sp. 214]NDW11762.1 DUF3858 domain-containing protein [Bacteroides sp. 214]
MRITYPLILAIAISYSAKGQNISAIPEELKKDAFSVVVNNQIEYTCESNKNAVRKESITITILDEKGKDKADFFQSCDKFRSLQKFSGEIFDRTGRSVRKIKKSDLTMSEYSSGLFTDDYFYHYSCNGPSYPFTVKYEWEMKQKDGIISYPVFMPQSSFNQSVQEATYILHTVKGIEPRYRLFNTENKPKVTDTATGKTLKITFSNLKAQEPERFGPAIGALVPYIYFNPTDFFFDGTEGSLASWESYGLWVNKLLNGRDELPPAFVDKLKEMTASCTTEKEKVKVLYEILETSTRYVSIQLGIGGFQPMPAMQVNKTGFGDCKALSNYMKAMLKAIGIKSYYSEISTSRARILKDYVSLNQTNHAVLQVPLAKDTLWLECTNAQIPFGYLHQDIAGHDAVVMKENGGEVQKLPSYADTLNLQTNAASITLDAEGRAAIDVTTKSHLFQYEDEIGITKLEPKKQIDRLRSEISLAKATVENVEFKEVKEENPYLETKYRITSEQYGSRTGNRLFIPVNIFRRSFRNMPKKERKHNIYIKYGYKDTDSFVINKPDGYVVEAAPKPEVIEGKFGSFKSLILSTDKQIVVMHELIFKTGVYSKEEYEEFSAFIQAISSQYNGKIILRKEN